MRTKLKQRRYCEAVTIVFGQSGFEKLYEVHFGFDETGFVKEVFCLPERTGTDIQGMVHDACIAISIGLQHGMAIGELASKLGELRPEGAKRGPPSSIFGAIAIMGAALEARRAPCATTWHIAGCV